MTETELTDRLRESIVLDGPDVWKTNSYLQDAQQAGIPLADALKLANAVSQEITSNSLLFQNIQARITRMAQPSRSQYVEQDLNQIVNAASSLKLSPDFVKNRWVPAVLQRLATNAAPAPSPPKPEPSVPEPVAASADTPTFEELITTEPEVKSIPVEPVTPVIDTPIIRSSEPVVPPLPPKPVPAAYSIPEKPPVVRAFTATPARVHKGQPVTLEWDVENLLAVTIDDLGEGLSPKNRGWVKPTRSMDYTLFDVNNNPLSTVRVDVIPRDRSGVYGVLFALALLAIIYWFIRSSNRKDTTEPIREKKRTSQSAPTRKESIQDVATDTQLPASLPANAAGEGEQATDSPAVASVDTPEKKEKSIEKPTDEAVAQAEPETKPATPADARQGKYQEAFGDKTYDKVELGVDERGWRRARSNGRWGYINDADEWVIKPEFEAVTPFRGNTASAFLNGQLITINRNGEQVRN